MSIQGLHSTADFTVTGQRPENWRQSMLFLEPNGSAPLYALTNALGSRSVDDPAFHWFNERKPTYRLQISAAITNVATTIPVVSGALAMQVNDRIYVEETGEIMRVSATPSVDTSLTVVRGVDGSTATAVDPAVAGTNPMLQLMGSAFEEGSAAPDGRNYSPEEVYNYTQIFRNAIEITGTAEQTNTRTGDEWKHMRRRMLIRHSTSIEKSLWFGRRSLTTQNGRPLRTMNGIFSQIPAENTVDAAGAQTLSEFEDWLRVLFTYGSNEKMAFIGNRAAVGIQQMVRRNASLEIMPMEKEFGMDVQRIITPFGTLVTKRHPLFNEVSGGTVGGTDYYGMDSWVAVLDMSYLKYVYLRGRDTKFQDKLETPGTDGMKAGLLTECSLEMDFPETFGLMKGLTAGCADAACA